MRSPHDRICVWLFDALISASDRMSSQSPQRLPSVDEEVVERNDSEDVDDDHDDDDDDHNDDDGNEHQKWWP